MNKMQILLRQLELENDLPVLSNAEIKKVTVNQNDCYHFFIASNEIIPFEEYRRFEKQLQTFPYPAKVSFEVTTPLYLKEEVLNYVDVIVDGRFEISERDVTLKFRGSSSQRIIDVKESLSENKVKEFKL
mgnify:CR=1 FL=1